MKTLWGREPAVILSLLTALMGVLIAFGVALSDTQQASLTALLVAAMGFAIRSQVTPSK